MTARMLFQTVVAACLAAMLGITAAGAFASEGEETSKELNQASRSKSAKKPMLAKVYRKGIPLKEYFVSEKLDGVRGRWTGSALLSKSGKQFAVPAWFTKDFPNTVLEGELWSERGKYQQIASITAKQTPHPGWQALQFWVFDMPAYQGSFAERVKAMRELERENTSAFLRFIPQKKGENHDQLIEQLKALITQGGEGLMLHHQDAIYSPGRSNALLKVKLFKDTEAVVIGYKPGKGKHLGRMGALQMKMPNGKTFYLGTGFTNKQRENPPPIGSLVTYKYQGFTDSGLPRFPVFLRTRK